MATKLVCDCCNKVIDPPNIAIRGYGTVTVTNGGIYLSGRFRTQRDGHGGDADVCPECVVKILMASDLALKNDPQPKAKSA